MYIIHILKKSEDLIRWKLYYGDNIGQCSASFFSLHKLETVCSSSFEAKIIFYTDEEIKYRRITFHLI